MSTVFRRITLAVVAMLACVLLSIIVIGGAMFFLIMLGLASVFGPLMILIFGDGSVGERIPFWPPPPHKNGDKDDRVIDI